MRRSDEWGRGNEYAPGEGRLARLKVGGKPRSNPRTSTMTKAQVEVITSVQRRRRWSRAEKERIVAAALEPGAVASEVARAAGIHTSQLFRWRQQVCERTQTPVAFNPVAIAP